jgi:DNA repair protein RAD5
MSVLGHWQEEIERHTVPGTLKVHLYYGSKKTKDLQELSRYDVVVTSYGTLSAEYKVWSNGKSVVPDPELKHGGFDLTPERSTCLLFRSQWTRCILDEAHNIRNRSKNGYKAAFAAPSFYRWCLTGTPIHNSLEDLYALICFIRLPEFAAPMDWKSQIFWPVMAGHPEGQIALASLMKRISLRRRKNHVLNGKNIINLPSVTNNTVKLDLDEEDLLFYRAINAKVTEEFEQMVARGSEYVMKNYTDVLILLLRLRQAACHPYLFVMSNEKPDVVKRKAWDYDRMEVFVNDFLKLLKDGQNKLITENGNRRNTDVSNAFKEIVQSANLFNSDRVCETCGGEMTPLVPNSSKKFSCLECHPEDEKNILPPPAAPRPIIPGIPLPIVQPEYEPIQKLKRFSTKCMALMNTLEMVYKAKNDDKILIVSQFTRFMDIIQVAIKTHWKWNMVRIDGSTSQANREKVIHTFKTDPSVRIIIVSIKSASIGINLSVANHVIVMDPWWNAAVEQQAIDRVHRIGQTKPIFVTRFVASNTVEERVLAIQSDKSNIADRALANRRENATAGGGLSFAELRSLFERNR